MLEVREVVAGYGGFEVLHAVSLAVTEQEIVALLGHNGAGKSTLLKTVYGLLPVRAGSLSFRAQRGIRAPRPATDASLDARHDKAGELPAGFVGYVPQEGNVFAHLSVADNLRLGAYSRRLPRTAASAAMDEVFALFPILRERSRRPASVLSGGERQMLAISVALMARPKLLLLDEPSAGLAPVAVQRVFDTIAEMRSKLGLTVLLVEQNVNEALRLASRAYVMEEGRIVFTGASAEREAVIHHLWGLARKRDVSSSSTAPSSGSIATP